MAKDEQFETTSWDTRQVRRRRRRRRTSRMGIALYLACVVAASAILAGVGWILVNDLCAFNKEYQEVTVTVEAGDSIGSIAKQLKKEGLIEYKWLFRLYCALSNAEDKIGSGVYVLNTNMDYRALVVGMRSRTDAAQDAATVRLTIPEGYTVQQIIELMAAKGVNSVSNLTEAAQSYEFEYSFVDNENLGDISRLEGYLFPDTYDFFVGENSAKALSRLLENFDSKLDADRMELVEASGRSLDEIIIIASLIEKETDGYDQKNVASVIYNRLQNPGYETAGLLQIDASVLYGLTGHTGALTSEDLQKDTPYNLYLHQGLPPTAIANPGLEAIDAALQPAKTSYYYYALGKDGRHHFSASLAEHNRFLTSDDFQGN